MGALGLYPERSFSQAFFLAQKSLAFRLQKNGFDIELHYFCWTFVNYMARCSRVVDRGRPTSGGELRGISPRAERPTNRPTSTQTLEQPSTRQVTSRGLINHHTQHLTDLMGLLLCINHAMGGTYVCIHKPRLLQLYVNVLRKTTSDIRLYSIICVRRVSL